MVHLGRARTGILRQNYRSHASLLSIPNRLFYGDQLQAAADQRALRPPQWAPLRPGQPPLGSSQGAEAEGEPGEGEQTFERSKAGMTVNLEEGCPDCPCLRASWSHHALPLLL